MESNGHEGILHKIDRILDKVSNTTSKILIAPCVIALVAWVLVVGVYITGRAIFDIGWQFVEEFTAYWLVLVATFAMAYTLRTGGHITIDIVTRLLPKRVGRIMAVIVGLIALVLVAYLIQKGATWFWYGLEQGVRSRYPSHVVLWPVYLLVPIGLAALGLELLRVLYRSVIKLIQAEGENLK